MFRRRAEKGQCFNQPYLGCREFSCGFRYVENPDAEAPPEDVTRDLGLMLYDLDFTDAADPRPFFFNARLERGVITVPPLESAEVLR
jgi:CRISPR-associated protein Cas5d